MVHGGREVPLSVPDLIRWAFKGKAEDTKKTHAYWPGTRSSNCELPMGSMCLGTRGSLWELKADHPCKKTGGLGHPMARK